MDPHGTHIPVLAAMVAATNGPILELGMGDNSTPLLQLMGLRRLVVSADSNPDWLDKWKRAADSWHHFQLWTNWSLAYEHYLQCGRRFGHWSVVLTDHAPAEERGKALVALADHADYFVVHDVEPDFEIHYRFKEAFAIFPFVWYYKRLTPWTAVVSRFHDPALILGPTA